MATKSFRIAASTTQISAPKTPPLLLKGHDLMKYMCSVNSNGSIHDNPKKSYGQKVETWKRTYKRYEISQPLWYNLLSARNSPYSIIQAHQRKGLREWLLVRLRRAVGLGTIRMCQHHSRGRPLSRSRITGVSLFCLFESVDTFVTYVTQVLQTSRWFWRRRVVGFDRADRAFGAVESNCPSSSKSSRSLQKLHDKGVEGAHTRSKTTGVSLGV